MLLVPCQIGAWAASYPGTRRAITPFVSPCAARGPHHPSHSTSNDRQPNHAAPDCSRAHRRDLRTGRLRRVRTGRAKPSSGFSGEQAGHGERSVDAADLGSGTRDRRRADCRLAGAAGAPARLRLPGRAAVRDRSRERGAPVDRRRVGANPDVQTIALADRHSLNLSQAERDAQSEPKSWSDSVPEPHADAALIAVSAKRAMPCAVSSEGGVEQWKLVGLITRRSSVRIRPPQFLSPADCLAV